MNMMMLSFIIPAKNEQRYIEACLQRIQNAGRKWGGNFEIILVDNGSTDRTIEIARKYEAIVIMKGSGNIAGLRNIGAKNARGDALAFVDADCLIDENWFNYGVKQIGVDGIAVYGTRAIPDMGNSTWVERSWFKTMSGAERPDFVEWLGTSNLLVLRHAYDEVDGFDENLPTGEDINFCYKIRKSYRIYLEKRINTIHLRESKTLWELFRREFWRGSNSLSSFLNHQHKKKEFLSVAGPAVYILVFLTFTFSVVIEFNAMALLSCLILIALPILLVLKKKPVYSGIADWIAGYIIASTYILARSLSLINECRAFAKKK